MNAVGGGSGELDHDSKRWLTTFLLASILLSSLIIVPSSTNNAFGDEVVATISSAHGAVFVGVNPVANKIYVADNWNVVSVIDGGTNTVTSTVSVEEFSSGIAVNPETNRIYVAGWRTNGVVTVIDGTTDHVIATIPVTSFPAQVAVNPITNMIYVAGNTAVSVIDGAANSVVSTIQVGDGKGVGVNLVTNKVYVTDSYEDTVFVIDGGTNSVEAAILVGNYPGSIGVNSVTNKIYVVDRGSSNVFVIDGASNSVTGSISVSGDGGIAVNPVTNKIYVTSSRSDTVSVIDGATDSVTSTLVVGDRPWDVEANSVTNKIYVTNLGSKTVSVIDGSLSRTSQLTVNTQDTDGTAISGYYVVLYQNGEIKETGFSPATFTLGNGQPYTVEVQDYGDYAFHHWLDTGSTVRTRAISISEDTQLTAVYVNINNPPPTGQARITVSTMDTNDNMITGYYTTLWKNCSNGGGGNFGTCVLIDYAYSPASFTVSSGQTYQVAVADYGKYVFDHWSDGSTSRFLDITPGSGTTTNSVAVYRITG